MAMTLGKDVSALFPDVLKNVATSDLDQKKLVYLYLMYESVGRIISYQNIADPPAGTMQNHILNSVSWRLTRLSKTRKIRIH
jgi:hypothetical protein